MDANIRVAVSGVSEAEQQLKNFGRAVNELSQNASKSANVGSIDNILAQVSKNTGGIDPFRSSRDNAKFSREVNQSYVAPLEQKKGMFAQELKSVENFRETVSRQFESGDISEKEYKSTISEINKEYKFYTQEIEKATEAIKSFGGIIEEVGRINQEVASGERDLANAPKGTRQIGDLETLTLQRARSEYLLQRETDPSKRNVLASENRELLKNAFDLRSEKILTTNQRAVFNPAFSGAGNVANSIGGAVGGSFGEIVQTSMDFTRDIREAFTLDLARSAGAIITAGTNLTASYAKMTIPKMVELEKSKAETRVISRDNSTVGAGAYNLGMNMAETNRALQGQYRSLGVGNAGLGLRAMDLEVGSGVGIGGFSDLFQNSKYFNSTNKDIVSEVGKMVSILGESGLVNLTAEDFSRMQEGGRLVNQVNDMQTGRFRNVDLQTSASIITGLEELGGTFKGNAGMGKFQSIDAGITSPQNDFVQATIFRALMAENPNMDLVDLEERMQAGALGKGNFNAVMKQVGMQSGVDTENATNDELLSNRMFLRNVARVFTKGQIADARGLIEGGRTKGKGEFDIFDRREGKDESGRLMSRAQNTDEITLLLKRLDDIMATQKGDIAKNFVRETTKFAEDPNKYLSDAITSMPNVIGDKIKEGLSGLGGIIVDSFKSAFGLGGKEETNKESPISQNTKAVEKNNDKLDKLTEIMSVPDPYTPKNELKKGKK